MSYDYQSVRRSVEQMLRANPTASLAEVSNALGISRQTLETAFRTSGSRFVDIRRRVRFQLACDLLASERPTSIKEVAALLGYTQRSFLRFIRAQSGVAPTQLRTELTAALRTDGDRAPSEIGAHNSPEETSDHA